MSFRFQQAPSERDERVPNGHTCSAPAELKKGYSAVKRTRPRSLRNLGLERGLGVRRLRQGARKGKRSRLGWIFHPASYDHGNTLEGAEH